ncbi:MULTISPECIES: FAD-binding and (Fe-S)-binding domain-containing protein [Mesonia]|uniref:Anaerobic glycerol-3-phosphate dehydrogenase subunit C n=1 Tax=Mesonia oceanica TaxID=2687242 RepID=A0AC61Y4Q2_9FLAO|nr:MULTISPECIES: FAD-binding and (Fe-S)-binding domain-containing protein [Mesonia]MAN26564.1 FAD-binding oxidoreductase [Mesonia sp.]MAQ40832.1 FAD-binding oxidoreductase [Mesonia sp.]MBJ97753.1 FAD-binding oxidoreductase [Flavobacteriaceae bacterium]VVU99459.1 Anaerobic glycerol-3-phosphate dehydrogenase subunit C [Mesonia oceanica]
MKEKLLHLSQQLQGEFYANQLVKSLYATDASVYRELPLAVALPKTVKDIQLLIQFCVENNTSLIPRAAGTSLAGQCVGDGIVVDISKYFTKIIQLKEEEKTVRLQPGVIRDDLNRYLKPYNLFFGPNTSTSNRCMIGGMTGNNSSGTTSIKYGVTRDKILEMKCLLSDGSEATFKALTAEEFQQKCRLSTLEGKIYRELYELLKPKEIQEEIHQKFPKGDIHRRNTGYAIDEIITTEIFSENTQKLNICKLLAGSEGTLAFTTELTLQLDDLPPKYSALIAAHFHSIEDCLAAVAPVMKHSLFTCEMMDKTILDCTKSNLKYKENRFFIEKDPQAILMLEVRDHHEKDLEIQLNSLLDELTEHTNSYAQPILKGEHIEMAIELRKAGLGLLGNMDGDEKAVACIEDTAVSIPNLANYINEFTAIMKSYGQRAVYYAHAGAGELHLRPILNLKVGKDVKLFKQITHDVARLVKKYKGSLSGEHGDGRLRAEFIQEMVGEKNYQLFIQVKKLFDPQEIFNPGKIVFAAPMETSLRYVPDRKEPEIKTIQDFSDTNGILRAIEKCNGTGDCRKSIEAGGTMCPSYRATKNEKDTTRGRANVLREFLTQSEKPNQFNHEEIKEVLDLCLSCKGCKSECPSNVDMASYKAEFLYQYQKENGFSFRNKLFAHNNKANQLGAKFSGITNTLFANSISSGLLKKMMGVAPQRSLPKVSKKSLRELITSGELSVRPNKKTGSVYLFIDEFTNLLDTTIGIDTIELLVGLGYEVKSIDHEESGRSYISKGFLEEAKVLANKNIQVFKDLISEEIPLIGIEPSAILSFRDEYLRLAENRQEASSLAKNVFLIEEFLSAEIKKGTISSTQFSKEKKTIKIHGHCHQKAMSNVKHTFDLLNLPENFEVTIIPSGCCGMAGSFGYEKEHYEISMQIGEQTLFPAIRKANPETIIVANGTSCRHQIKDGTQKNAHHPVSILNKFLLK